LPAELTVDSRGWDPESAGSHTMSSPTADALPDQASQGDLISLHQWAAAAGLDPAAVRARQLRPGRHHRRFPRPVETLGRQRLYRRRDLDRYAFEPEVTSGMFTPAERAAWTVAIDRGLAIEPADLRALLLAAFALQGPWECPLCHNTFQRAGLDHEPCAGQAADWTTILP
jgi:hypothetical protein